MTLKSMTGFGHGHAQGDGLRIDVEISSVNRKQLDVNVSLPRALQALEPWILEQLSHDMSRGRVSVQVALQFTGAGAAHSIQIRHDVILACVAELSRTAKKAGIHADITLGDVLRIPGVVAVQDAGQDIEKVQPLLGKALAKAMTAFIAMRKREGGALARELGGRLGEMEKQVAVITKRAPGLVRHYREALRARIQQLAGDLQVPDDRLEKEVVMYADRSDITEEVTRLAGHLEHARVILRKKEPAGRALDFLAQEMFREINTIGAKAADAVISSTVVQFKTDLERFREQVQNIE